MNRADFPLSIRPPSHPRRQEVLSVEQALVRAAHAAVGRVSAGISPVSLALAWVDWALNLAGSPGTQGRLIAQGSTLGVAAGRYEFEGEMVSLHAITTPVFVVGIVKDLVSPWQSVFKIHLHQLVDADLFTRIEASPGLGKAGQVRNTSM